MIAEVSYGQPCPREVNLSFINNYIIYLGTVNFSHKYI